MRLLAALALVAACGGGERTKLVVRATDGGKPIAARVVLFDERGEILHRGKLDLYNQRQGSGACKIGPHALATWGGLIVGPKSGDTPFPVGDGPCEIPPGRYKVWAWHGFEYERFETTIDLSAGGTIALDIPLVRAWSMPDTITADMHVHASKSNDSTMPDEQRALALAASGVDLAGIANHNQYGDIDAAIHAIGLDGIVASLPSSELTSEALHVGVYPVPAGGTEPAADTLVHAGAAEMFAIGRALPTHPIIQVNHPRFRYGALFDLARWDGIAWPPPFPTDFDAVEVIAGYSSANIPTDRRIDDGVRDLYTLTAHGKLVAVMGNSDTHDFTWVYDGTARTYAYAKGEADFVDAVRARRTIATTCPMLDVKVDGKGPGETVTASGGRVAIEVDRKAAAWCGATRTRITVGGALLVESPEAHVETMIVVTADTWIGVTADGDGSIPLAMTGTYQRDKWKYPGVSPYAVISPILVRAQ